MNKLLFGTAGIPVSSKGPTEIGINDVKKLGLDAMELEFVHSIHIRPEKAPIIEKIAQDNDIILTCHAPYFINLNSAEKQKLVMSKQRIVYSARILSLCGGWSCCFHPGFYQKSTKDEAFSRVKEAVSEISKTVKEEGNKVWIRLETTGKVTQFGTIEEICDISASYENVMPCIDFAHLHARSNGKHNSYDEFSAILALVEKKLGKKGLQNMHIHITGIAYNEKGEKNHLTLKESDMKYQELLKALKDFKVAGVAISESPNIEEDALLCKKEFARI